jgi:hypothetical protein
MTESPHLLPSIQTATNVDTLASEELDFHFELLLQRKHTKSRIPLGFPGCAGVRWVDLVNAEDGVFVCFVPPPNKSARVGRTKIGDIYERLKVQLQGRFPPEKTLYIALGFTHVCESDCTYNHRLLLEAMTGSANSSSGDSAATILSQYMNRGKEPERPPTPRREDRLAYSQRLFVELHEQVCSKCRDARIALELATGVEFLATESM